MANASNSILDKQVQKAFALKYSIFVSDHLRFHVDLTDWLKSSPESKQLWLDSRKTAVHDFTVVHKCTHLQHTITDFFHSNSQHAQPTSQEQQHWQDVDMAPIPVLI
eukprot:11059939-Ditylum_brightwellii.AAC.1